MASSTEDRVVPAGRPGWTWLVLALAALLSSWNPFAAPLGLLLGLAAAALGFAAVRRRRGNRAVAAVALALGALAALVSGLVLALTAGAVTAELSGEPVVKGRSAAEAAAHLDAARAASEPARQRARRELEAASSGAGAPAQETAREDAPLEPLPQPEAEGDEAEPE